jgi:hypothetical protein
LISVAYGNNTFVAVCDEGIVISCNLGSIGEEITPMWNKEQFQLYNFFRVKFSV